VAEAILIGIDFSENLFGIHSIVMRVVEHEAQKMSVENVKVMGQRDALLLDHF
jgi:hypothetical protein